MKKRRALLIGVPEYESDAITDLPIVCRDIEYLHASLEKSGFNVRSLGTDGISQTGRSKLLQALRRECKEAQGIEILLLYFSGHGMHYRGKDYLIPSDAVLDDAEYVEEYLVSTDIGDIIDQSGAETIIFFIDACREGVKLGFKDTYLAGWSRGERRQASRRSFVMVFACGPGQVSQYVSGEEGFSLFSKALAEVLDPQHFACTLKEVLDETQAQLNTLIAEQGKQSQKIYYAYESAVDDNIFSRVICKSVTAAATKGKASDPWSEAALQSPLWKDKDTQTNSIVAQLKQQVAQVLAACWQEWQAGINAFPQDQWRDEALPSRVLEVLDLLVLRSDPPIELTDAETALVVTAPFVREAVLASGLVQVAKANPLSLEETNQQTGLRSAIDKVHQSNPRLVRKAQRLQAQGRAADKDAVMTWLLHRCLLKTLELWMPESEGGNLSSNLLKSLQSVSECSSRLSKETLTLKRLLELARCLFAGVERIDRDDRPEALQSRLAVGGYSEEQQIREKMVAYLLKLAGLLAIDIRTFSDVLIDHIGLSDPLTPNDVRSTIAQARWNPSGRGRTLRVTCHHPAVDLVIREHVEQANLVLVHILRQVEEKRVEMEVLVGLPMHLSPDGVIPEKQNGVAVYQTPHVNFQLAHDEVRELLMGEQLYGDPRLAIRELYQNALDACRYREARLKYLKQTGKYQGQDETWEGRITFCQAKDEEAREYIECEDNGIGMGMQHLSQCFARAGRRFADFPEFIEEQAEWLKCDPPIRLYPNSQFGIGVLSYFMLADEIEVETCRLNHQGQPGQRLKIKIPGSSGLFRVQDLGGGKNSGTKIRLYLNLTHYQNKPISCLEILKQLLWVADFKTEVKEFEKQEVWQSGQLRHPELSDDCFINANHADLWWITEKGRILSDGLVTEETHPCIVVNLSRYRRPKLTVDRKKIVDWDKNWAKEELIKGWESLLNWSSLSMEWLWKLETSEVYVAEHIVNFLIQNNIYVNTKVKTSHPESHQTKINLEEIGCFFVDKNIEKYLDSRQYNNTIYGKLHSHREIIWQKYKNENSISSSSLISYPVPRPGDAVALLLTTDLEAKELQGLTFTNFLFLIHLIKSALILDEPLAKTFTRLQKFSHLGLKIPNIDVGILDDLRANSEDLILLSVNLDGKNPWLEKEVFIGHLAWTAIQLNKPIAKIYKRLKLFSSLGLKLPKINLESLNNLILTQEDLFLLSEKLNSKSPWIKQKVSPIHILKIAHKLDISVSSALQKLQKFIPLGFELPEVNLDLFEHIKVTQEILSLCSTETNGRSYIVENRVTLLDILLNLDWYEEFEEFFDVEDEDITDDFEESLNPEDEDIADYFHEWLVDEVTRIIEIITCFVPLGIELQQVEFDFLNNLTLKDLQRLEHYLLYGEFEWDEDNALLIHLLEASCSLDEPVAETLKALQKFASLGIEIPELSIDNLGNFVVTYEDFNYLCIFEDGTGIDWLTDGFLEPVHIDIIEYRWQNMSISDFIKKMQKYIPLGVKVPKIIPENIDNLTNIDKLILYEDFFEESASIEKVSLIHILRSAYWLDETLGKTIERFQKFLAVGVAGIKIPKNIPESLSDYKVTYDDLKLLSEDFNMENNYRVTSGKWLTDKVPTLHIIQAVVKLEKSVIEIVNSLQRYVPLGLDVSQISPEILSSFIPSKEDMIVFSQNLDSNVPFFKEKIPNWQIVRASVALNKTVAETLKQVQRFIPLGVEVPETNSELLGDFTANQDDVITLSQDLDQNELWLENEISLIHILRVSMWLKKPVITILIRLQKLTLLGFKLPEIEPGLLGNLIVTQADLVALSEDLDAASPWIEGKVSSFHIRCASQRLNEPITRTLERLQAFSLILNLQLPEGDPETWLN